MIQNYQYLLIFSRLTILDMFPSFPPDSEHLFPTPISYCSARAHVEPTQYSQKEEKEALASPPRIRNLANHERDSTMAVHSIPIDVLNYGVANLFLRIVPLSYCIESLFDQRLKDSTAYRMKNLLESMDTVMVVDHDIVDTG